MYTFAFASLVHLRLQTKLPLSWGRGIPGNIGPSSWTFRPEFSAEENAALTLQAFS